MQGNTKSQAPAVPVASPSLSVSACNCVSGSPQIFSQFHFHLNRCFKRHRVQVFVKLWHQAHAIFPHDPGRFIAVFVILESVIDWDSCHADIDARLEWIAFGIQPQNRRMSCDGITQQKSRRRCGETLVPSETFCSSFSFKRNDTVVLCNSRLRRPAIFFVQR